MAGRGSENALRVAMRSKVKTLDPADAEDYYSNTAVSRAYEGLLHYHFLKRPYELEPLLAERMPEVSRDGRVYVFRIQRGVFFQDDPAFRSTGGRGRELVAEDVVYSWKRLADPRALSTGWWIFKDRVVGFDEWRARKPFDFSAPIEGLRALGRYGLEIRLKKPYPQLSYVLAMPYAAVVAREAVERYGEEFRNHPVGTGPFALKRFSTTQLVWERNPTFREMLYPSEGTEEDRREGRLQDAGRRLPFVDRLVDDVVIEDQPAFLKFMRAEHDVLTDMPKDSFASVVGADGKPLPAIVEKGISVHQAPAIDFTYFAFNMADPLLGANKPLRQAMALAYDAATSVKMFYMNLATVAQSPVPPNTAGYEPAYRNPYRKFDPARARELLANAGYPDGKGLPEITLDNIASSTNRQVAEYFQRCMGAINVRVRINLSSFPEMLDRINRRKAQMWGISWLYDYPDPENAFQLLYGPNETPGSNAANYRNARYDALFARARELADGPERRAIYRELRDIFAEDVPWILGVHRTKVRLTHPWVRNYKIHHFEHTVEHYLRVRR